MTAVTTTSATAEHNGHRLVGAGPNRVLVLHGWLADTTSWSAAWTVADQDDFTWCFVDARGYGLSRERRGEYTVLEYGRDAIALADALGWDEFSLAGHSMAGMAIQRALQAAPERVRALIGVAAVPASGGGLVGERRELFDRAVSDPQARAAVVDRSTGGRLEEEWVGRFTEHSFSCADPAAVAGFLASWAEGDFHAEIIGNPVPVGVVVGEHDASLSPARMEATWLSWYPNSRLEVISGAGHYPMQEQPAALMQAVQRLLLAASLEVG
ncbi:alpha/beta hydrolase [Pseudonocardia sp. RS11V-5]|uniref:alpha/beta fold hydrolase n=1 Tax=Pseudonocardia terrae TaxID=2905831 RepID=UPI001E54A495|nr:alpha/beta hydrolase [Pseudonocardia terrae]MCE3555806.1 alpha/beta hydrolase [Pseudonocardia terrae]